MSRSRDSVMLMSEQLNGGQVMQWTLSQAATALGIDDGFLRRVLSDHEAGRRPDGIPGVEKVGNFWIGEESAWRDWDAKRRKLKRRGDSGGGRCR